MIQNIEYCCKCGKATGRAGRGDDSIYIGDNGPFCEECCANPSHDDTALLRKCLDILEMYQATLNSRLADKAITDLRERLEEK